MSYARHYTCWLISSLLLSRLRFVIWPMRPLGTWLAYREQCHPIMHCLPASASSACLGLQALLIHREQSLSESTVFATHIWGQRV